MTINEFGKIISLIRGAFPHMDRFKDDDVKDVWFECLNDLEYGMARTATINVIKSTKDFPPDIATIREEYERLVGADLYEKGMIKTYYQYACGSYPIDFPSGTGWEEWQKRVKDGREAELFYKVILQYLNELDGDAIDFVQCVKTICRNVEGKIYFKGSDLTT